ncbi:putative YkwD family protein [Cytobacillus eiseniae]|uniref:YkwD family protein n=1 Tax=Cytobacillus eiseniae TaxID=762947 RepID=A0ABS4REP7_9BACI|nr:CAP domain-containing protein [Cytobacillus eiseniae]MBP2241208.1 putative YkwD family protein [Cytobacillus eiseniae]
MNKKVFLSVAAAAALLVSNPVVNKADAASNCPTPNQVKAQLVQSTNLNNEQINSLIQKVMKDYNIKWNFNQSNIQIPDLLKQVEKQLSKEQIQKPVVNQPAKEQTQKPAEKQPVQVQTQKPAEKQPAQTQTQKPVEEQPAQTQTQKPVEKQPAQTQTQKPAQTEQTKETTPVSSSVSAYEQKVLELTNQERAKNGVSALSLDVELSKVARTKSADMKAKGYFDHNSPTYGSPFDMMKQFGISYKSAGENIAMGQRSPEEVVNAWMNSEGHRKNILNANYTHLGIGHVADGNYWTQMFIGK